ncbi:Non-imprinted in Prader-Willi/Angelman syndrome region protein [Hibiscus syriacus]|uniref:Non-imprinted in Prader-Willi/Angelman syndrome region protein n=1 Tax=Hibiscus syriacus TaxID=106335 RepID=A0A6A2XD25_HIBSY|nr:Non-imprinted in Prader-Willi/Angelman syndrome region protein [Hibiscus syriacus]
MAATVSSPWGKPSAWALDAEEHEAELQQQIHLDSSAGKLADFPSLSAAASSTKSMKKKPQTVSLAEFTAYGSAKPSKLTRLTHEEALVLPTSPRQRAPEELDRNRLGGGFKSYGSNRYNSSGDDSSSNSRWGSSRASNRDSIKEIAPSRADEIDNWASAKKSDEVITGHLKKEETGTTAGTGGVRPKLVLQPRTVPVTEDIKKEVTVAKPKGANPFGEARPREEVLKEKGKDWKEIDEKLEAIKIKETVEEERGRKASFGNGSAPVERSWRKNDSLEAAANADQPQSSEAENGHVAEN